MEFILARAGDLSPLLNRALGRYRYRVFIETLGWQLDTPPGIERDRFDRPETVHVIARDDQHAIVGYARLLPTTGPYLLGEMFPQLMNGLPPPCSEEVWELSRFAVMDLRGARTGGRRSARRRWRWTSCNWRPTTWNAGAGSDSSVSRRWRWSGCCGGPVSMSTGPRRR